MVIISAEDLVEFSNANNTRRITARVLRLVSPRLVEVKEVKTGTVRIVDAVATHMRPFSSGA